MQNAPAVDTSSVIVVRPRRHPVRLVMTALAWVAAVGVAAAIRPLATAVLPALALGVIGACVVWSQRTDPGDELRIDEQSLQVWSHGVPLGTVRRRALQEVTLFAPFVPLGRARGTVRLVVRDAYGDEVQIRLGYFAPHAAWAGPLAMDLRCCYVEVGDRVAFVLRNGRPPHGVLITWQ